MAKTSLLFMPVLQFFDNSGQVLAGGTLTFYEAGTTTLKNTYADSAQAVTNANPIILDSAGRPDNSGSPIQIWLDGAYKLVVKDSTGSTIRTEDNLTALATATGYEDKSANYTVVADDYGKFLNVDASSGDITISLPAVATVGSGFIITIGKADDTANTVVIDASTTELINGALTKVLYTQYDTVTLLSDGTGWVVQSRIIAALQDSGTTLTATDRNVTMTAGDLTLTSGDATLTAGDLTLTLGDATLTEGDLTLTKGDLTVSNEDSRTDTVDYPLTITSTTDGVPAAGIGVGALFRAESGDGTAPTIGEAPADFGAIEFAASDITDTSEDTYFQILLRTAGAALSKAWRFVTTSSFLGIFTHANTADRTYTLADNNATLGAGWEKISETSASSTAAVSFTGLSNAYREYRVLISGVTAVTDGSNLLCVLSDDGVTYAVSGYYYGGWSASAAPATSNDSSNNGGSIVVMAAVSNQAGEMGSAEFVLCNPQASARGQYRFSYGGLDANTNGRISIGQGISTSTDTDNVTAIRFVMSSGNIATGKFTLYGVRA